MSLIFGWFALCAAKFGMTIDTVVNPPPAPPNCETTRFRPRLPIGGAVVNGFGRVSSYSGEAGASVNSNHLSRSEHLYDCLESCAGSVDR